MKWIITIILIFSSLTFSQNLYFSEPTSTHIDYIWVSGKGPIAYNMYVANGWVVNWWRARIKKPNGTWTDWEYGETGGWWVSKAGTYQIRGEASAVYAPSGESSIQTCGPFSFTVVDVNAPAIPQNFSAGWSGDHPVLTWNANTEYDLDSYTISKMIVGETGWANVATVSSTTTQWVDSDVSQPGAFDPSYTIKYKVRANDINSNSSSFSSEQSVTGTTNSFWKTSSNYEDETITVYHLYSNYPNPFNPSTKITFQLPESEFVNLSVFNSLGQEVKVLVNSFIGKGKYSVSFDAFDLPSGIYIYKLQAGNYTSVKKMMLTK